ncbi:sulfatase [Paenibacillus sp. N3.4]|uniref:sulfatase n=1 Tax=Paenibacillus sp. N3.4 TaxID=2603222 RepID=UPI0011C92EB2|nr:sulfatase [Paenibacillus sp. N3.4]TXK83974.1 sulfatase [Paenibacillus sp. N3.4]
MKAVMLMFDSLNKHMLPSYGCDWIHAPNFNRLSELTVTFDKCYAGSLPCMPARRELHTGRYNFLHRSWGPLEPFDDSMIGLLRKQGIYTHLTTDHVHYFEDGGATYHGRYNSWEFARGQEGDPWKGQVENPTIPENLSGPKLGDLWRQDWVNRQYLDSEEKMPLAVTIRQGIEFMEKNQDTDRWFLTMEAFDPHEPFFTQQKYKDLYPHVYEGKHFDWPDYGKVKEQPEEVQHAIYEYAALVSMCDEYLGQVLDAFDKYNLWKDTMLIVNTDHGFLLGEHQWWGKNIQPFYNEIANIPLYIWDPRYETKSVRSDALVQTIDLAPTLLDYFGVPIPDDMQGHPLSSVIEQNAQIREAALFGIHGGHVNCTDGRYVYMRAPHTINNAPLYEYTLMPTHMHTMFSPQELKGMELAEPFSFTKGCQVMKLNASTYLNPYVYGDLLFDLEQDSTQKTTLDDTEVELRMIRLMSQLMVEQDAPREQFERVGISVDGYMSASELAKEKERKRKDRFVDLGIGETWKGKSREAYFAVRCLAPAPLRAVLNEQLIAYLRANDLMEFDEEVLLQFVPGLFGPYGPMVVRTIRGTIL